MASGSDTRFRGMRMNAKPELVLKAARDFAAQNPPPAPDVVVDMRARLTFARDMYEASLMAIAHLEPVVSVKAGEGK